MASAETLTLSRSKSSLKQPHPLEDLVAPRERLDVPNHIIDTKIFSKLSQNATTKVEPSVVHFAGYSLNKIQTCRVKICNSSADRQNFHIVPPATKHFTIKYTKPRRFVPGFTIDITISFVADEWRYYYDCLRIHCKGEDNLIVPLHAYPVVDTSNFPRKLVFSNKSTRLGESYTHLLPLSSNYPVEFEFKISILQSHPSFKVDPLFGFDVYTIIHQTSQVENFYKQVLWRNSPSGFSDEMQLEWYLCRIAAGIVPGEGKTNIHVTFTPMEYVTAHMSMQLSVSQFNTKPLVCDVTASCQPPAVNQLTKSVKDLDELYKQTKLLDPRTISPVQIARRRQKGMEAPTQSSSRHFERDGYQFLTRIDAQHAVNSVLLQEKGKMKMKDLREVMQGNANAPSIKNSVQTLLSVESSHQMKQAAFEMIVRQDAVEERANQLRWQVRCGESPMTEGSRVHLLKQREVAALKYRYHRRKDPDPEHELERNATKRGGQRSWRRANQASTVYPEFDLYKNNPWSCRHRALDRFQQAARTILIRCRAQKKAILLRKMIEDYNKALRTSLSSKESVIPFQVEIHERGAATGKTKYEELLLNFSPDTVRPFTFPVFVSPDSKEDIAPDALGEVPLKAVEVDPSRRVPFNDLVVPKYYEIAGYSRYDVGEALKNYVTPGLARPLKTGAEDEIIKVTLPIHLIDEGARMEESAGKPVDDEKPSTPPSEMELERSTEVEKTQDEVEEPSSTTSGLIPPPGLFKNPTFHKLQIFNRAPGVLRHSLPIPQSEVDQDAILCPVPKSNMLPGETKLLDREDVIKGVMNWKKVSSHGLSALSQTPTLLDVWLPRWTDTFSQAMIPSKPPPMLTSLPEDDVKNILDEEPVPPAKFPLLTTDMIKNVFAGEEELKRERDAFSSEESFIEETMMSTTLVSSEQLTRVTSKGQCQEALEKVMMRKHDKLGSQIQERLCALEAEFESN